MASVASAAPTEEEVSLSWESLVTIDQDVEPYVLEWPDALGMDGAIEVTALVIMKRPGGVLLAVPTGMLPAEELLEANQNASGVLGPSTEVNVPTIILDGGSMGPTGEDAGVLILDCSSAVIPYMRAFKPFEFIVYGFDAEQPFALPEPQRLLSLAKEWLEGMDPGKGLDYVTAAEGETTELQDRSAEPQRPLPAKTRKAAKAKAGVVQQQPGGKDKPVEKPKRPTTTSLQASLADLMQQIPNLSTQLQTLALRQNELENQVRAPVSAACPALQQPLSHAVRGPASAPSALTRGIQSPPRTQYQQNPGILHTPVPYQPPEMAALALEKPSSQHPLGDSHLAQAVLAQSQALTSLVSQIAQGTSDPMLDLGGASSTGTRGSLGRAKLQAELAAQRGSFFNSVLHSMSRRMQPTLPAEGTPLELFQKGVNGTRYLERFGGYGRHRDLGQIQWQVMQTFDFLQAENLPAARDSIALLAVTLEQAVLDNGRFELAAVLCLQDDLPAGIFQNRQSGQFSRSRSFAPLADQRWITVALAYLKEMDTIQSKRLELTGGPPKQPPATPVAPTPKTKPGPKKKGKGKGQPPSNQDETEET